MYICSVCVSYICTDLHKKEIVALARTVRKKDFVFLARVRVSSEYFPVLDCVSYRCARKRSWLSLWLGLAVGIVQCWNVYCTVRKNVFVFVLGTQECTVRKNRVSC